MRRFINTGERLYQFSYLFLVRCPRCDSCAEVVLKDRNVDVEESKTPVAATYLFAARRLVCTHCGYVKEWEGKRVSPTELEDWYFHRPLWLQTSCCGEVLWAFNKDHLDFLEDFVGAGLREAYPNGTIASRLPEWMKSAKNRNDVLKCIRKLRGMLPAPKDPLNTQR